jgi:FkbM family methyltransferase
VQAAARLLKPLHLARFPWVRRLYRGAFKATVPGGATTRVPAHGLELVVDPHDGGVGYQLYIGRGYEATTTALVADLIAPGATVLDLGANVGWYTLLFAARVGPTGRVLAFEPAPENADLLARSLEHNRLAQVELVRAAVSDQAGTVTLHLSRKGKGLHSLSAGGDDWDQVEVECLTLDERYPDLVVDFLKIDIEGAEESAFRGMEALLARSPRLRILTEVNPTALAAGGSDARVYLRQLLDYGFRIEAVVDEAAERVLRPGLDELLELCARRPTEVKHWNCNVLLAREGATS